MIIGYIYRQKCNENAKKKRLIYFELWKLWKHSGDWSSFIFKICQTGAGIKGFGFSDFWQDFDQLCDVGAIITVDLQVN